MNIFQWLKHQDYDYTWNVRIGARIPDVIAFNDKEISAFEIKKYADEILKAVGQCLVYLKQANKAYIILPAKEVAKIHQSELDMLKKHGIGLIQANDKIKVLIEPKFFPYYDKEFIELLKNKSLSKIPQKHFKNIDNEIVSILKKHPEGLSITEISKFLMMHRHTITKYIYQLIGAGIVCQRKIGPVRLCYLNKVLGKDSKVSK
jgi:predicted transcriptional regulator